MVLKILIIVLLMKFSTQENCNLSNDLIKEIQGYRSKVQSIIDATTKGEFKGKTYEELAKFVDKFGARQVGTESLEKSIDYLLTLLPSDGYNLENVNGEIVNVSRWIRGSESAEMITPRSANIPVLALGGSVSTPETGITADVIVFKSFDEMEANKDLIKGKIVVFNNDFVSYGISVQYRSDGPIKAAEHGAVAVLVRSVTPFSMRTLHTGQTKYDDKVTKIPAASITVEDAHMFQRYQDRKEPIRLKLILLSEEAKITTSRNTVAEIVGSTNPEQVILVSGHLDSWDVGVGAMDDGGGAFISWYSLVVLKALGLRAKRTVRSVLWTSEETGMAGVQTYDKVHKNELENFLFVMESDEGTFSPKGLEYVAGLDGGCILEEILKLLSPINATQSKRASGGVGSDITIWKDQIPTASLMNENDKYFWFHHTNADTMDVLDPDALDRATALWASVAYVIADMSQDFPKNLTTPYPDNSSGSQTSSVAYVIADMSQDFPKNLTTPYPDNSSGSQTSSVFILFGIIIFNMIID